MGKSTARRQLAEIMEGTLEEIRACRQIRNLAVVQAAALREGRVEEARAVTEVRAHLLDYLRGLEESVAEPRESLRGASGGEAIGPLLEEVQSLVREILRLDEENREMLHDRMLATGQKLQELRRGEEGMRAFLSGDLSGGRRLPLLDSRR